MEEEEEVPFGPISSRAIRDLELSEVIRNNLGLERNELRGEERVSTKKEEMEVKEEEKTRKRWKKKTK